MIDGVLRRWLAPVLDRGARVLVRLGVSADTLTVFGLACGGLAALSIAVQEWGLALAFFAINRAADGLDGAIAGLTRRTDRGGFLDIVSDFFVYGAVPLAFAFADPGANALSAALLLMSFYVNGASFLAFAAIAAKRGMTSAIRGTKSLYFTTGLVEGGETIVAFVLMIAIPTQFPLIATAFAGLCFVTALARIFQAWRIFAVDEARE